VRGFGEYVNSTHALQAITSLAEMLQIVGEGTGVAGDANDLLGIGSNGCLAGFGIETSLRSPLFNQLKTIDCLPFAPERGTIFHFFSVAKTTT